MALSTEPKPAINGIALCAGYGGLELGLHIAEPSYRTVCFVEREAHAAAALVARMEDAALDRAPIWNDLKTFKGRPWRGRVHIVSAGYPCQPFSSAGRRRGAKDPRHLWPDVRRVVSEVQPEWVFLENVQGHLDLGFPEVGQGLRRMGFQPKAMLGSAFEVGASHERARLFVLAHADRLQQRKLGGYTPRRCRARLRDSEGVCGQAESAQDGCDGVASDLDATDSGRVSASGRRSADVPLFAPGPGDVASWHRALRAKADLQPAFFGMADGLADRLDRSRGAGNGVCPLAAAFAYRTLRAAFERPIAA